MKTVETEGLPGRVTPTAFLLHKNLSLKAWGEALGLLGNMVQGVSFWIADALIYGEDRFGEKMAAHVEVLGLNPKTMMNLMAVGRAFPPSKRREALTFGHHEAVARLQQIDQTVWLNLAEKGDKLPNGEQKRWSVSRLRHEMRALAEGMPEGAPPPELPPDTALMISEGRIIKVNWAQAGVILYRVESVYVHEEVLEVRARRAQG